MKFFLGSQSPRRKELLSAMGYEFEVLIPTVDEIFPETLSPYLVSKYISNLKLNALIPQIDKDCFLICADTIVLLENEILGKPKDRIDAVKMLNKLSGKTHEVITGVSLYYKDKKIDFSEITSVSFKSLSDDEISYYIDLGDAFDKAGSYGIQDWIGTIGIQSIEGSYTNVMGLPTQQLQLEITKLLA